MTQSSGGGDLLQFGWTIGSAKGDGAVVPGNGVQTHQSRPGVEADAPQARSNQIGHDQCAASQAGGAVHELSRGLWLQVVQEAGADDEIEAAGTEGKHSYVTEDPTDGIVGETGFEASAAPGHSPASVVDNARVDVESDSFYRTALFGGAFGNGAQYIPCAAGYVKHCEPG